MRTINFNEALIGEWLRTPFLASPLNAIGLRLLSQSRYRLALLVFTESLRINPYQPDTRQQLIRLKEYAKPKKAEQLPVESCMVSVIMRTRSRTEEIRESIQSVLDQSLQDLELIVVNDGGTDLIGEIASSFDSPKIRYFKLNENQGPSGAMNAGLVNARGRYISYLDDDDIFYPNHLETLVSFLEHHEEFSCVYSNAWWCHGEIRNDKFVEKYREPGKHPKQFEKELFFKKNWIVPNTLVYRRDILLDIGLFNEDIWYSEDWEHFIRIAQRHDFHQLPIFTTEYRWKQDNASHKKDLMDFHSTLIFRFYYYRTLDIIALEDSTHKLDATETKKMFLLAKSNYHLYRDRLSAIRAIFYAHQFLAESQEISVDFNVISDYFNAHPIDCLTQLAKGYQVTSLLRLTPQIVRKSVHKFFHVARTVPGQQRP
ncbi:MAG: glycosyltransferase [Gammaproteobacteria bacterium]|nr:glycosyltransferase [Gammaproteobacteria bacterium]